MLAIILVRIMPLIFWTWIGKGDSFGREDSVGIGPEEGLGEGKIRGEISPDIFS
jgi:hypothetical protein